MEQHTSTGLSHGVDSNLRAVVASTRTIIREPGTRDAKVRLNKPRFLVPRGDACSLF